MVQSLLMVKRVLARPTQYKVAASAFIWPKLYVWFPGAQTEEGEDIPELKGLIPRMVEYVFSIIAKEERNVRLNVMDSTLGTHIVL